MNNEPRRFPMQNAMRLPLPPLPPSSADEREQSYFPEHDPRWQRRFELHWSRPMQLTRFDVVINGKPTSINAMSRKGPRVMYFGNSTRAVNVDLNASEVTIDGKACCRINEPEQTIDVDGRTFHVFVRGPQEKLWIDGHLFNIRVDAPPEVVFIARTQCSLYVNRGTNEVFVDGRAVCPWSKERAFEVVLRTGTRHTFQFFPPSRHILIDGESCLLDLSLECPAVRIKGRWHGIRFDGRPREVLINDETYLVDVSKPTTFHMRNRAFVVALGGPGHEVIIEDEWHEVGFGGQPVFTEMNNFRSLKIQLLGAPPDVKILGVMHVDPNREPPLPLSAIPVPQPVVSSNNNAPLPVVSNAGPLNSTAPITSEGERVCFSLKRLFCILLIT